MKVTIVVELPVAQRIEHQASTLGVVGSSSTGQAYIIQEAKKPEFVSVRQAEAEADSGFGILLAMLCYFGPLTYVLWQLVKQGSINYNFK